jgi:hypothetical protein
MDGEVNLRDGMRAAASSWLVPLATVVQMPVACACATIWAETAPL